MDKLTQEGQNWGFVEFWWFYHIVLNGGKCRMASVGEQNRSKCKQIVGYAEIWKYSGWFTDRIVQSRANGDQYNSNLTTQHNLL
jgi:hypothetical protein